MGDKQYNRLKEVLRAAYHDKEKTEISDSWQTKTMRYIRDLGPQDAKLSNLMSFEKLVWRLVPVTGILIFVFSVCLFNIDFVQEYEIAKLFVDDPIEYAFVQSFGN